MTGTSSPPAISARGVGKAFHLPGERHSRIKDLVVHPFRRRAARRLVALQDLDLEVPRGEFLGIVGRNGSGKSTLLRCLAGIYRPEAGELEVRGRVAPFIELGVGFHPELAARDNVLINAVMLGMSPAQARERFDAIVAFAELERFVDVKLKNYSSGMVVRLAFAVTIQVDADVLLFDEVLAVGDAAFQEKCYSRFAELKAAGRTVLLVTHDMSLVERFCDRAVLLERGRLTAAGDPAEIARRYAQVNEATSAEPPTPRELPQRTRPGLRLPTPAELRRTVTLVRTLALAEFKLRYLDATLSYFWGVARPLALFGILYFIFSRVGNFSQGVSHYGLYLLTSIVLWTYFAQSTGDAVASLVRHGDLLRKVPFPRAAIPLSVGLTSLLDLGMNLLALFAFVLASGIAPRVSWLELPVLIALLTLLVAGVSLLLSALYVRFRDIDQVWLIGRQALFYATPIVFAVSALPADLQRPLALSPLAAILSQARHALVDPHAPTAAQALGSAVWLVVPLGIIAIVLVAGLVVFHRDDDRLAELV